MGDGLFVLQASIIIIIIIIILYGGLVQESTIGADGRSPHSAWRNYDDFNEFFWAPSCFEISWPWRSNAGFFKKPNKLIYSEADRFEPAKPEQEEAVDEERKVGKTHFVEHRTGLHLYHSFHRFWIFLVCMLQGLTIFAFCNQELHIRSLKYIMSVGPTFIVMKFLQCTHFSPPSHLCFEIERFRF
jgi:callose synthase